jgi:hypothetical protein
MVWISFLLFCPARAPKVRRNAAALPATLRCIVVISPIPISLRDIGIGEMDESAAGNKVQRDAGAVRIGQKKN